MRGGRVIAVRPVFSPAANEVSSPTSRIEQGMEITTWTVEVERGAVLALEGPAAGQSETIVRFLLLDGTEHLRVLSAGRLTCAFPYRAQARRLPDAVFSGMTHVLRSPAYWVFLLSLALLCDRRTIALACGAFFVGHVFSFGPSFGHGTLAIGGVVIAAGVARASAAPSRSIALVALLCGLLQERAGGWSDQLGVAVGTDALMLAGALLFAYPLKFLKRPASYGVGASSVFVALALAVLTLPPQKTTEPSATFLPALGSATDRAETSSSVAVTPMSDDAVQLFLDVGPFETRVEALLHLPSIGLTSKDAVAALYAKHAKLLIDGEVKSAGPIRANFVARTSTGVVEQTEGEWVGIVQTASTKGPPERIELRWSPLSGVPSVPVTVTDPQSARAAVLTGEADELVWADALALPRIHAVNVSRGTVPISVLFVAFLVIAGIALFRRFVATAQFVVAGACLVTPYATIDVPWGRAPSEPQTADVVEALLTNVYRSLEQTDERAVYDRLGVSVTQPMIAPIYLEQRRVLELGRRGGARVRVESVEVVEIRDLRAIDGDRLGATVVWEAGGFVVHFGHRHFRQNRYEANLELAPVDGSWKIAGLAVHDNERVR